MVGSATGGWGGAVTRARARSAERPFQQIADNQHGRPKFRLARATVTVQDVMHVDRFSVDEGQQPESKEKEAPSVFPSVWRATLQNCADFMSEN
jgi:hypothetical protein